MSFVDLRICNAVFGCLVCLISRFALMRKKRKEISLVHFSTFRDATSDFPAKWSPRNDFRNSTQMTCHYSDLGCVSDWFAAREIGLKTTNQSTTQIWVVTRYQYRISAVVAQTSFGGETSSGVAKCRLVSQACS